MTGLGGIGWLGLLGDAGVGGNRGRGFRLVVEAGGRRAIGLPAPRGTPAYILSELPDQTAVDGSCTLSWLLTPLGMVALAAGWPSATIVG